jgi:hypothetical protein
VISQSYFKIAIKRKKHYEKISLLTKWGGIEEGGKWETAFP